jgi:hypothetical protein
MAGKYEKELRRELKESGYRGAELEREVRLAMRKTGHKPTSHRRKAARGK